MAHTITVNELQSLCTELVKKGKGRKKILISSDDEGNGYHELFFGFTENASELLDGCAYAPYGVSESNIDDYVILG